MFNISEGFNRERPAEEICSVGWLGASLSMHFQPLYKQKAKGSAAFIAPYRLQSTEGCNKVQVPKIIRWTFKLEPDRVLRVGVSGLGRGCEYFYTKMGKDGRIFIPKAVVFAAHGKEENLAGLLVDITLEPA